jgi:hypothetical protein
MGIDGAIATMTAGGIKTDRNSAGSRSSCPIAASAMSGLELKPLASE